MWIRQWNPSDVDKERVTWVRCFGVPMHAWNPYFFSKIVEHVGTYMYLDDNTEIYVARVMIRTCSTECSTECLNQSIKVHINNVPFFIKIVEDWCGPLQ